MAYYLQLDGVDDYLQMTGVAITDIYIDVVVKNTGGTLYNVANASDIPEIKWNGSSFSQTGSTIQHFTTTQTGSTDPAFSVAITPNQRITVHAWNTTAWSGSSSALGRTQWSASNYMAMNVYDVKMYNGATLVAHYDMSTQTVLDQSGNGRNATLTGGTWVTDSVTTYTGSGTSSGTSTTTSATPILRKQANGTANGTSQASATPILRLQASGASNGTSSTTATIGAVTQQGSGTSSGTSSVTAVPVLRGQASGTSAGMSSASASPALRLQASGVSNGISWTSLNLGGPSARRKKSSVNGLLA